MTAALILFNYFRSAQSFSFAIRKTFPAMREKLGFAQTTSEQSRDCMQRTHAVETAQFVTNGLRTCWHLDGSHGVRDGG